MIERLPSEHAHHILEVITKESFLQQPQSTTIYSIGDNITRENWASFVEQSFSRSIGVVSAQFAIFDWNRLNRNFDWKSSLQNFIAVHRQLGHWEFLAQGEKDIICTRYKQVLRHTDREESDDRILDVTEGQLFNVIDCEEEDRIVIERALGALQGVAPNVFEKQLDTYAKKKRLQEDRNIRGGS